MIVAIKSVPLCGDGYNFLQYKDSRTVIFEDQAQTKDQKAAREKALKEGKLAPEMFDKSFVETPKAFYADLEKQFDATLGAVAALDETCQQKFGDVAPGFGRLTEALTEVRQPVHSLLQKKRETEPDPVEEAPVEAAQEAVEGSEGAEAAEPGETSRASAAWFPRSQPSAATPLPQPWRQPRFSASATLSARRLI